MAFFSLENIKNKAKSSAVNDTANNPATTVDVPQTGAFQSAWSHFRNNTSQGGQTGAFQSAWSHIRNEANQGGQTIQLPKQERPKSALQTITAKPGAPSWRVGDRPGNYGQAMANIANIAKTDKVKAQDALKSLRQLQNTPGSIFYKPYSSATNQAVNALRNDYGIDPDSLTDDWMTDNGEWLYSNLNYSSTTNSVTKPGKRASSDQWLAWNIYQYMKSEEPTRAAEREVEALKEEIAYLTGLPTNLSDEAVRGAINWKKYPTLSRMRNAYSDPTASLMETNRGIDVSDDMINGTIWAARNGGNLDANDINIANYYMNGGSGWQEDPEITKKLTKSDDGYAPYTVSMTCRDAGLYFGVPYFPKGWVQENAWRADSEDETERAFFASAAAADYWTEDAEAELEEMNRQLDEALRNETDPAKVISKLDSMLADQKFSHLAQLDKTTNKNTKYAYNKLIDTSRPIDFSYQGMVDRINARCAENRNKETGDDLLNGYKPTAPVQSPAGQAAGGTTVPAVQATPAGAPAAAGENGRTRLDIQHEASELLKQSQYQPLPSPSGENTLDIAPAIMRPGEETTEEDLVLRTSQDELRAAYDAKHGEGAYDRDLAAAPAPDPTSAVMPTPSPAETPAPATTAAPSAEPARSPIMTAPTPPQNQSAAAQPAAPTPAQQEEQAKDRRKSEAYSAFEGKLNAGLQKLASLGIGSSFSRIVDGILLEPLNPEAWTNPEFATHNIQRSVDKATSGYTGTAFGSMAHRTEYEKRAKERDSLLAQIEEIEKTYGDQMLAREGENIPDRVEMTLLGNEGFEFVRNQETGEYEPNFIVTDYMRNQLASLGQTEEAFWQEANQKAAALTERTREAEEAYRRHAGEDLSQVPEQSELDTLYGRLRNTETWIQENQAQYDRETAELESANARRNLVYGIVVKNGGTMPNQQATDSMLDYIATFGDWERTYQGATVIQALTDAAGRERITNSQHTSEKTIREAKASVAEIGEKIEDAKYALNFFEDLPQEYRAKIEDYIDWLEDERIQYNAFLFMQDERFGAYAEDGREQAMRALERSGSAEDGAGGIGETKFGFAVMTPDEQDIYYAILGRDGVEAADRYYAALDTDLRLRTEEAIRERSEELAQSGPGGRIVNLLAGIGMAVPDVFTNGLYMIGEIAGRKDQAKWMKVSNRIGQTTLSEDLKAIDREYSDENGNLTAGGHIIKALYEIMYNRGRSMMTGQAFGGLFDENTNEILQAFPMAFGAMGDAIETALDNNANGWQAAAIGLITFFSESLSEGIEFKHIKQAFNGSGSITRSALKDYFINLIPNGLQEAFGESVNDVAEKAADYFFMPENSKEFNKLVQHYTDQGIDVDEAYARAMADNFGDVLHTAVVSFFSPGMDITMVAAGSLAEQLAYAEKAREISNLSGEKVTARQLRKGQAEVTQEIARKEKEQEEYELNRPLRPFYANETETEAADTEGTGTGTGEAAQDETAARRKEAQADAYDQAIIALENARNADSTSQQATLTAVLGTGHDTNRAAAAATNITEVLGENGVDTIENVMAGGGDAGVNIATLKIGVQYALLGNGECRNVMNSEEFRQADAETQAQMLAEAVKKDTQNHDFQVEISQAVHDYRVNFLMQEKMANGEADAAVEAKNKADAEKKKSRIAEEELEQRTHEADAAADSLREAGERAANASTPAEAEAAQDDIREATSRLNSTENVEHEYQQKAANQEEAAKAAEENSNKVSDETLSRIRQESEDEVAQMEAEEARQDEEARARAEQDRAAMEQKVQEENERNGKAWEARRDSLIEAALDQEYLEEGEERDRRRKELTERANQIKLGRIDMSGLVNNSDGYLAVGAIGRRLGVEIQLSDKLPGSARGMYKQGVVYLNANMIREGKMTIGQALVEATLHEITHAMENTKSYQTYRDVVLQSLFGEDAVGASDAIYESNARFRAAVNKKISDYRKSVRQELSIEDAEREIVADFARTKLNERDVVMRMLDKGIGGKMRNALHNINQALKNFRLTGKEKETAEYLRRAERTFQKMINESARSEVHPAGGQFSVAQIAQATGLGMVANEETLALYMPDPNGSIEGNGENGLEKGVKYSEVDGVKVRITPDMIVNTPVGQLIDMGLSDEVLRDENGEVKLDEDGNPRTQKGDARKMFADLMNLCARYREHNLIWEIAGSEVAAQFSALKSNSDPQYKTTVDFGTICAKTQAIVDVLSGTMLEEIKAINAENETAREKWIEEHGTAEGFKPKVFTGLSRQSVMKVYDITHGANLSVPCPVCYVFSRWMGVPSLLGQMNSFQNEYVALKRDEKGNPLRDENGDAVIDWDETSKLANSYIKKALEKYGSKEAIAKAKTSIQKKIETREASLPNLRQKAADLSKQLADTGDKLTARQRKALEEKVEKANKNVEKNIAETDRLAQELKEVEAYNWVTQALCLQVREGNTVTNVMEDDGVTYKVDRENFRLTPEEVLFDLNRTGEFAGYSKNWTYRTTRGAGMGKSIMPYSGASIGDIINGKATRWTDEQNPFRTMNRKEAEAAFERAKRRVRQQNLVGGQRFQSTSDFRPEWGLDYVMSFLEMQALGSKVQMYTKVSEAVDFLGSIGVDLNQSIMGQGNGYHEATAEEIALAESGTEEGNELRSRMGEIDGTKYVMDFSDVTGMDYATARTYAKKYNNVQMILVGMNDVHIRLAMASNDIDFIIPWHSSGNSRDVIQQLVGSVNETLTESSDYTAYQNDMLVGEYVNAKGKKTGKDKRSAAQIALWDARMKLLTEGGDALSETEINTLLSNPYTRDLYIRFTTPEGKPGYDPECYGVTLTKDQAEHVFPYEYWDKTSTRENADVNGKRFAEYCDAIGLVPRFSQFKDDPGYWKLLIDRKMYDNNVLNEDGTVKEYGKYRDQQVVDVTKASIGQLPTEAQAKYGKNYSAQTQDAIAEAKAAIEQKFDATGSYSAYGDITAADMEQMLSQAAEDYQSAVERGDMEAAAEDVETYAAGRGYTEAVFHGTESFGFTEFDLEEGDGSIFVTYNPNLAGTYTADGEIRNVSDSEAREGIYRLYARPGRQLEVEADGANYDRISWFSVIDADPEAEGYHPYNHDTTTREIAKWAREHGYDSVRINAVYDDGGKNPNADHWTDGAGDIAIFFNKDDVKSADPVTRDDQGNVIPLDQRFTDSPDIRYMADGVSLTDINTDREGVYNKDSIKIDPTLNYRDQLSEWLKLSEDEKKESNKVLVVGATPKILEDIGLVRLPMVIDYKHVRDSLEGTYKRAEYRDDHIFDIEEFGHLLDFIADPVAIIKDPKPGSVTVIISMKAKSGKKVLIPVKINARKTINGLGLDVNDIETVHGNTDTINRLLSSIEKEAKGIKSIFYINNKKTHEALSGGHEADLASLNIPDGYINTISESDLIVNDKKYGRKTPVRKQTDTMQFKRWFGNSKVTNPDGSPRIVYHGSASSERFTVFKPGERGEMWFSSSAETAYNKRPQMYEEYLHAENPYEETAFIGTHSQFDPVKVAEEGRKNGHDGAIVHWRLDPEMASKTINNLINAGMTDTLAISSFSDNFTFLPHGEQMKALAKEGETLIDFLKRGSSEDLYQWYAVYKPTQIKSATENIGLYDGNNTDSLYSAGGTSLTDLDTQLVESGVVTQEDVDAFNGITLPPTGLSTNVMPEDGGPAQRQFGSQTAQESDALHDEVKQYLYTHSGYTPDSNQAQVNRALDWVRSKANDADPDGYRSAVDEVTSDSFDYRSADGQARMLTVMGMAALKGDTATEMRLADAYNRQGTDLGQQLQARKLFRMMTPVGRMSYFQKQVDQVNQDIGNRTGKCGTVHLDEWTMRAIAAAENEQDFQKIRKAVAKEIGEQIPANWKDKLRSWRMLAMLGNPRTHIRNIIGNAMFIPAVSLKNKMGALMELGMEQGQRTKTLRAAVSKEIRNFARADAETMKGMLTGEAKYNEDTMIEREKRQFKGVMQVLSDFNSNALEAEDWFFLKGHYRRALGGWMQANGYTVEQMQNDPELMEKGRAYAIQEAQKATYRDFNGLAAKLTEFTRDPKTFGQKVVAFGAEAVLPFKKTPANILKRGIEYSPVGIAKALTTDLHHLKQYNDYQKGKLDTLPEGAITPNQFIDNLSAGLTGTAVMALGAILGSMGLVSCGFGDDDDDKYEKAKGAQEYAIRFSIGGEDYTFTLDWAAPMCMPFFVGAAIQEQAVSQEGFSLDEVVNAMGNITEPVFNLSMLDGVNSLLEMFTNGSDTNTTLTQLAAKVGLNYMSSLVPSALGAIARTVDTTRRKAFVPSGQGAGIMGTARYSLEQLENRIPGLSQTNIPYRDVWGKAEESGLLERILENFVLPGYIAQYKDDPIVNELAAVGKPPQEPGKTFSANGEKYVLTDKEWDAYKETRGKTAYNLLGQLFATAEYQTADPDDKAALVDSVWSYANDQGKKAAVPELNKGEGGETDPLEEILSGYDGKKQKKRVTENKQKMVKALGDGDYEGFNAMVEALREDGVEDKAIKEKIGDTFRDQYKDAYRKEDYARMDDIAEKLKNSGFEFNLESWENAVKKEAAEPPVTRSMPGLDENVNDETLAQRDKERDDFIAGLNSRREAGTLADMSVEELFDQVDEMTGGKPWDLFTNWVGDYVDYVDPDLEGSVEDLVRYLEENGHSIDGILKRRPEPYDTWAAQASPAGYIDYLMDLDDEGTLDVISMSDFFDAINELTNDRPWSVLSDDVERYVDYYDFWLRTSVADMMDYLYKNGKTEDDILKKLKKRLAPLRSRQKRYADAGKGVEKGQKFQDGAEEMAESLNYLESVADGTNLDSSSVEDAAPQQDGPRQTFNGDLSSVESYDKSWLPYYEYGHPNKPIWDDDAPDEAKKGVY